MSDTPRTDPTNARYNSLQLQCYEQRKEINRLNEHVTELENRLRALWDKLEGERKHYMEQISDLEKLGDTLANCTSDNPYNARYAEQWWDLRGIKHE